MLPYDDKASATLAWGALLHDVGKPATFQRKRVPGDRIRFNGHVEVGVRIAEEILRRLRFSNEDTAQIVALVKNHMRFGDVMEMRESTLKRFLRLPKFEEHLALHWLDASSCHGDLRLYEFAKERFEAEPEEAAAAEVAGDGGGFDCGGVSAGAGVQGDAGGGGGCAVGGSGGDDGGGDGGGDGAVWGAAATGNRSGSLNSENRNGDEGRDKWRDSGS